MTQLFAMKPINPDTTSQLLALLELRRGEIPFADEELARHRTLRSALEEQRMRSEETLAAWRHALAQRWEAEVHGQRTYLAVQRQIAAYFDNDAAYLQLIAPSEPATALTPTTLLADMRRLAASLALLRPRPSFVETWMGHMHTACSRLALAIAETEQCEAERRRVLIEQRMALNLYERICQKTQQLVAAYTQGDLVA